MTAEEKEREREFLRAHIASAHRILADAIEMGDVLGQGSFESIIADFEAQLKRLDE